MSRRVARGAALVAGASLLSGAVACARQGSRPVTDLRCLDLPATPIELRGDLHALYAGGPPTFHLQWNGRSSQVIPDSAMPIPRDSLLTFARRAVVVTGRATADTATICATGVRLASGSGS